VALPYEGADTGSRKHGSWNSEFKDHLKRYGIKPILARVKYLQTNGKLERFFGEYENRRSAFRSFGDFIGWYNDTGILLRRKKLKRISQRGVAR